MLRVIYRLWLFASLIFGLSLSALADERITAFDVQIDVQTDGDILVTETIDVTVEGRRIKRGIFRDLPRYYTEAGDRYPVQYKVLSVTRAGQAETYTIRKEGNAYQIRIGDADHYLPHGAHQYRIRYAVKNQVRYFGDFDEIYLNATGTYWVFPIDTVTVTLRLPDGGVILNTDGYTGRYGSRDKHFTTAIRGQDIVFETTQALSAREGMSVSVSIEKGLIDPPSVGDQRFLWWLRNGAMLLLSLSLGVITLYYYSVWNRHGRDPAKPPVFPRYGPPEGYNPAAVSHIYYKGFSGHKALIATLMNLGVHNRITIKTQKKETVFTRGSDKAAQPISREENQFESHLFKKRNAVVLSGRPNKAFIKDYTAFKGRISAKYGKDYHRFNIGYMVMGLILSASALAISLSQLGVWKPGHIGLIAILGILNVVMMFLMPAPTQKGQDIRTQIEGFRLYMNKAEKLQLNAVDVGVDAPPPMTTDRYERFLPYAVALGVEKPWTHHFEALIPDEAENYAPHWGHVTGRHFDSVGALNKSLVSNLSSGVSSAMPQSQSSSGASGGGFSGGGGGGGGGGGW